MHELVSEVRTKPSTRKPATRMKMLRIEKGMTLIDLAAVTGIDPATLSKIERGIAKEGPPLMRHLLRLADALGEGVPERLLEASPGVASPKALHGTLHESAPLASRIDAALRAVPEDVPITEDALYFAHEALRAEGQQAAPPAEASSEDAPHVPQQAEAPHDTVHCMRIACEACAALRR